MKKNLILLSSICLLFIQSIAHPFYVSVTQIDYKENSVQITLKIFIDDLQAAIDKQGKPKLYLAEANEHADANKIIEEYLRDRFTIIINNNMRSYQYLGKEEEEDAVWVYLEIPNINSIERLEVRNSIITEKYEGQTNLIHTNINGEKKSLILSKDKPKDILTY